MTGKTIMEWMAKPIKTVAKYQARLAKIWAGFFISMTDPATRNKTPIGAKLMIQDVNFIMIETKASKNFKTGLLSSPTEAMATPKTKLNITRPEKIFVKLIYFSNIFS